MAGMDDIERIVKAALLEDIGSGDLTSRLVIDSHAMGRATICAEAELVLAGMDAARLTFLNVDKDLRFNAGFTDGERLATGAIIAHIQGRLWSLLAAERTALNFLQRASGIATLTAEFVKRVSGTKAKILDTRKTVPGLRALDKAAVKAGGGLNHRIGLFDGILIKDNHIAAVGGISEAIKRAKTAAPRSMRVDVEVTNQIELEEAIKAGADVIMLDNMNLNDMADAVRRAKGRVLIEASGGVTLDNVAAIAATGVDFISVGALTHSAPAADISMDIEKA